MRLVQFLDVESKFCRVNPDQVQFLAPNPSGAVNTTMLVMASGAAFSVLGDMASTAAKLTVDIVQEAKPLGKIAEEIVAAISEGWGEKEDAAAAREVMKVLKEHFGG